MVNFMLTEWRRIILALLMVRHGLPGQRWKLRPGANYLDG